LDWGETASISPGPSILTSCLAQLHGRQPSDQGQPGLWMTTSGGERSHPSGVGRSIPGETNVRLGIVVLCEDGQRAQAEQLSINRSW
jgi:hypothetical protein